MKAKKIIIGLFVSIPLIIAVVSCDNDPRFSFERESIQKINPRMLSQVLKKKLIVGKPLVMIVKSDTGKSSQLITRNLKWALKYTKIPYQEVDKSYLNNNTIPPSIRVICFTPSTVVGIDSTAFKNLVRFVAQGNTLVLTSPIWNRKMAYLEDIKPFADYELNKKAKGYNFKVPVLPGLKKKSVNGSDFGIHYGLKRENFVNNVNILATAANDSTYPVIIQKKINNGQVILFNTSSLATKKYRGMVFSSVIKGLEGVPYLTANVSSIFIDDFPQPLYNDIKPPINKEYGITDDEFVTKKWWPDIKKLAQKYGFKYSCMLVFNYNNEITPPFDFDQWTHAKVTLNGKKQNASPWLLRQARKSGYEIGFHGYNHISLMQKIWRNEENMEISVRSARKGWQIQHAGALPVTYVPPNDYIDSIGIQSLVRGMPSLRYLCSTFTDSVATGNGREFDIDPYSSKLFDYPRITSGYVDDNFSLFEQENVYIFSGIWNHFIHPDDIYDLPRYGGQGSFSARNIHGLGWHPFGKHKEGLYEVFDRRLKKSFKINPLLRIKPVMEAVPLVEQWRSSKVTRTSSELKTIIHYQNELKVEKDHLKYWYSYVPKSHARKFEGVLKKQSFKMGRIDLWDGYLYQFSTTRDDLVIPVISANPNTIPVSNQSVDTCVLAYVNYLTPKDSLYVKELNKINKEPFEKLLKKLEQHPESKPIQNQVIKMGPNYDRWDISLNLLKKRLLNQDEWQEWELTQLLNNYFDLNMTQQVWPFLEKRWDRFPDEQTIKLKDYTVSQLGAPNDQFQKKWLLRAIKVERNNERLKAQFVSNYQSEADWPLSKRYLKQLISDHPASDTLYRFAFQHSTWYDKPDTTLKLLKTFPPKAVKQLSPYYSVIADLYAYNAHNLTKAIQWAERDPEFDQQTILNWLLQQKRYSDFIKRSKSIINKSPESDSLRTYVGLTYLDNGYTDLAYQTLYPLFGKGNIDSTLKNRLITNISDQSYGKQKKLYKHYPNLFLPEVKQKLIYTHRFEEAFAPGLTVAYATDNYKNTLASSRLIASWGDRLKYSHFLSVGNYYVSSDINNHYRSNSLQQINYNYLRYFKNQKYQLNTGAGIVLLPNNKVMPNISGGIEMSGRASYSSLKLQYLPVYTNVAVNHNYRKINLNIYNELYLNHRHIGTSQSVEANRYSNSVLSWEFDGRVFYVPHPKSYFNIKPELMYSYSSATKHYDSGVPYWTPNNLQIEGAGLMWTFNKKKQIPIFTMNGEILVNNDNENGVYLSSFLNLSKKIFKFWQLSLKGALSTSKVYRSNSLTFSISYFSPGKNF